MTSEDSTYTLMQAATRGRFSRVKQLVEQRGDDPNKTDSQGFTSLMQACWKNHTAVALYLIAEPAVDVNQQNNLGHTALMMAIVRNNVAVVQALLARSDTEVNIQSHQTKARSWTGHGRTALHVAVQYKKAECVRLLLAHPRVLVGIRGTAKNNKKSPVQIKSTDEIRALFRAFETRRQAFQQTGSSVPTRSYFALQNQNEALRKENTVLKQQLEKYRLLFAQAKGL